MLYKGNIHTLREIVVFITAGSFDSFVAGIQIVTHTFICVLNVHRFEFTWPAIVELRSLEARYIYIGVYGRQGIKERALLGHTVLLIALFTYSFFDYARCDLFYPID